MRPRRGTKASAPAGPAAPPAATPDGRYIIVDARLWRASNPALSDEVKDKFVNDLMDGRREVKAALKSGDADALRAAHLAVDRAKVGLGERGPPWWTDGAPDFTRKLVKNTPYAAWFVACPPG